MLYIHVYSRGHNVTVEARVGQIEADEDNNDATSVNPTLVIVHICDDNHLGGSTFAPDLTSPCAHECCCERNRPLRQSRRARTIHGSMHTRLCRSQHPRETGETIVALNERIDVVAFYRAKQFC